MIKIVILVDLLYLFLNKIYIDPKDTNKALGKQNNAISKSFEYRTLYFKSPWNNFTKSVLINKVNLKLESRNFAIHAIWEFILSENIFDLLFAYELASPFLKTHAIKLIFEACRYLNFNITSVYGHIFTTTTGMLYSCIIPQHTWWSLFSYTFPLLYPWQPLVGSDWYCFIFLKMSHKWNNIVYNLFRLSSFN